MSTSQSGSGSWTSARGSWTKHRWVVWGRWIGAGWVWVVRGSQRELDETQAGGVGQGRAGQVGEGTRGG